MCELGFSSILWWLLSLNWITTAPLSLSHTCQNILWQGHWAQVYLIVCTENPIFVHVRGLWIGLKSEVGLDQQSCQRTPLSTILQHIVILRNGQGQMSSSWLGCPHCCLSWSEIKKIQVFLGCLQIISNHISVKLQNRHGSQMTQTNKIMVCIWESVNQFKFICITPPPPSL